MKDPNETAYDDIVAFMYEIQVPVDIRVLNTHRSVIRLTADENSEFMGGMAYRNPWWRFFITWEAYNALYFDRKCCRYCNAWFQEHAAGKCLFAATSFELNF